MFSKLFDYQDLTSFLSKVVRLLVGVFKVKISLTFYKICFMPHSATLSIKKQIPRKKNLAQSKMGGSRVGTTAVKDSMVFLKASLNFCRL